MLCPKCSGINDNLAAFCQSCGTNLKFEQASGFQQNTTPINQIEYAGFVKRFAAFFIDGIILSIVILVLKIAFTPLHPLLSILIMWLYSAFMESSQYQATIGKMVIGIIITDLNGNKISFSQATVRYFAKFISGIILYIGFIMVGFTEKKQGLHDILAGCLVVMKNKS